MAKYSDPTDAVFHALADANRRRIVERLGRGPASVSDLAGLLAISLPAVVQHLQVLEASSIVHTQKLGRVRTASLDPAALRTAEAWLAARRTTWERRVDRLADLLDAPPDQPDHQS